MLNKICIYLIHMLLERPIVFACRKVVEYATKHKWIDTGCIMTFYGYLSTLRTVLIEDDSIPFSEFITIIRCIHAYELYLDMIRCEGYGDILSSVANIYAN